MKLRNIFIPAIVACSLNASDDAKLSATQQYPFSEIDKALFSNVETHKMESPYSTASVKTFSKDMLVTIEEDAYNKLRAHAVKRSEEMAVFCMKDVRNTPQENCAARQYLKGIGAAATESCERFRFMKTTGCHSQKVQLSQHDLVHLLQWSNGIETTLLGMMGGGDATVSTAFSINISLDKSILNAPTLLRDFILKIQDHEQTYNQ